MTQAITPTTLWTKRTSNRISGQALCAKLSRGRSWLTTIERSYTVADPTELARIDQALDELIAAKHEIERAATAAGWPAGAAL